MSVVWFCGWVEGYGCVCVCEAVTGLLHGSFVRWLVTQHGGVWCWEFVLRELGAWLGGRALGVCPMCVL